MDREFSFGAWIKKRRTGLGLSRGALAGQVGYSVAMLRKIEDDERRPSEKAAALLAKALAIPPEQVEGFLKVARQEAAIDRLDPPVEEESFPWQSASAPRTNLPLPPTLFVGREKELAHLGGLLEDPTCRLVTLVGLAGIGKTRLAIQAAHSQRARFEDGVFFVSLAPLTSPKLVAAAISNAMGLELHGSGPAEEHLLVNLQEKHVLLLLDNFEHLIEGAELLSRILQEAPRVRILVTSRERLHLQGEWVLDVPGLPYPASSEETDLESVRIYEAVQLFLQGAMRVHPGFTLDETNWKDVVQICRLMEGMPLGIELAAAWVRALSGREIAREIQKNLDFLKASARDIPERHRSLRAALDQSWDLLSPQEKEVFARLAVFRGGFRKEAAREVAGASLENITTLLDKSLLKRAGEDRYDLHELVRQYTNARLQADAQEYTRTRDRHSRYYAALLEDWAGSLRGPGQMEALQQMDDELDNIRDAWSWMTSHRQGENIHRSLRSLWNFHEIRARFREGAALFGEAVAAFQSQEEAASDGQGQHAALLARLQAQQGYFLAHLDRYEESGQLLEQSASVLRSGTDQAALAETLTYLAYMKYRTGALVDAGESARESLGLNRMLDNTLGIVFGLIVLSYVALAEGEYEQAYTLSSEGLSLCRDLLHDPHGTADCLITLIAAARRLGRYDQARTWAEESLEISRTINDRWSMAQTLRQLGLIHLELGETDRAEAALRQSLSRSREVCDLTLVATVLIGLGMVSGMRGRAPASKEYFLEALKTATKTKSFVIALQALLEIASLEMREGNAGSALELATYVLNHASPRQDLLERAGQLRSELTTQLPPAQVGVIEARAGAKSLEDLIEEVASTTV